MRYYVTSTVLIFALIVFMTACGTKSKSDGSTAASSVSLSAFSDSIAASADSVPDEDENEYPYAVNYLNPVPLGTPYAAGDIRLTLLEVRQEDSYGELEPKDDYVKNDAGSVDLENYAFVICRVRVENIGDAAYDPGDPYNETVSLSLVLDGTTVDSCTLFTVDGELLNLSEYSEQYGSDTLLLTNYEAIEPGDSVEGDVLFIIEKGADTPRHLRYEPSILGVQNDSYYFALS